MKILVPTDGSSCALRAFKYAAKLSADNSKSKVVSLSVHDHHVCLKGVVADYLPELPDPQFKTLRVVSAMPGTMRGAIDTAGDVAEEIVKIAESGGFDLIVMGAKGRSPIGDLLVGSVAQKVLIGTRLPVTLVK